MRNLDLVIKAIEMLPSEEQVPTMKEVLNMTLERTMHSDYIVDNTNGEDIKIMIDGGYPLSEVANVIASKHKYWTIGENHDTAVATGVKGFFNAYVDKIVEEMSYGGWESYPKEFITNLNALMLEKTFDVENRF